MANDATNANRRDLAGGGGLPLRDFAMLTWRCGSVFTLFAKKGRLKGNCFEGSLRDKKTRDRVVFCRECQLGKERQLIEQFAAKRLLRLKLKPPLQFVPGGLVLSISPQGHSQPKISLDQIRL